MALVGAEWVLYLLVILSLISISILFERFSFYKSANRKSEAFTDEIRKTVHFKAYDKALKAAQDRVDDCKKGVVPLDASVVIALIKRKLNPQANQDSESLFQVSQDALLRSKNLWEKNLSLLASIGSNSPFIGLFGTVLGIIQAFHSLSGQSGAGAQAVTAGLSEALIATAIGILVAIPAVIGFNLYNRKVQSAVAEAEALQNYLVSHLSSDRSASTEQGED